MIARLRAEGAIFLLAVQFLTRLPVAPAFTPERLEAATRYFPAVGAVVGGLGAGAYGLAGLAFPPLIAVLIALAAMILLTGAFHEDGLADMADGIGGGASRDRALEIMRDSRIGTYGAAALLLALALKAAALTSMPAPIALAALPAAHVLSRLSAVLVIAASHYVRDHGTAKPVARGLSAAGLCVALATGIGAFTGFAVIIGWAESLAAALGVLLAHVATRLTFEKKLGGYTGDCLGAVQQTGEIGFYLGALAVL